MYVGFDGEFSFKNQGKGVTNLRNLLELPAMSAILSFHVPGDPEVPERVNGITTLQSTSPGERYPTLT
jgi:hypothetical protein